MTDFDYSIIFRNANPEAFKIKSDLIKYSESLKHFNERIEIAKMDIFYDQIKKYENWKYYFSFIGDKMNGFIGYMLDPVDKAQINSIKIFSFNLEYNNFVLFRDLHQIFKELQKEYKQILWMAYVRNEIGNNIYQKVIKLCKGVCYKIGDRDVDAQFWYFVPGTQPVNDYFHFTHKPFLDYRG